MLVGRCGRTNPEGLVARPISRSVLGVHVGANHTGVAMTRSESLELVLFGWVDALRRRNPDRVANRLADDIVWQGLHTDLVCRDRAAVLDNIRSGGRHRDRISGLEIDVVDDERVLLAFRMPGVTELYGEPVAGEIHSIVTLRGDVIARIDEFRTKDEAINSAS